SFVLNVHLYFPISSASPIFGLFSVDLVLLLVLLLTFLTIHIFITKYFSSARIRFVHSTQGWSCRTPLTALAFRTPALTLSLYMKHKFLKKIIDRNIAQSRLKFNM